MSPSLARAAALALSMTCQEKEKNGNCSATTKPGCESCRKVRHDTRCFLKVQSVFLKLGLSKHLYKGLSACEPAVTGGLHQDPLTPFALEGAAPSPSELEQFGLRATQSAPRTAARAASTSRSPLCNIEEHSQSSYLSQQGCGVAAPASI